VQFCLHIHHRAGLGQLLLQSILFGLQPAICSAAGSRRLRPRGTANPASAVTSRALRHSVMWLEYSPSRRSTAPFSPSGAAS
jgi:hypothetical protein